MRRPRGNDHHIAAAEGLLLASYFRQHLTFQNQEHLVAFGMLVALWAARFSRSKRHGGSLSFGNRLQHRKPFLSAINVADLHRMYCSALAHGREPANAPLMHNRL